MRHFTNESTRRFFFSEVMKRSVSGVSIVRMRLSKKRTFWISGHLKFRPGCVMTSRISPSWNTMARSRWSTVNIDIPATRKANNTATSAPTRRLLMAAPPARGDAGCRASAPPTPPAA